MVLIGFGVLSVLIISKTYQVDKTWRNINVDRYTTHIGVNRIWSSISVDNIQNISS